ncbi:hypothetical protein ACM25O_13115 [Sulfitobacter pontiacus]
MNDTFRLKVLKTLTAALEQVTTANGYQHDLTDKVVRGRVTLTAEDGAPPLVAINEKPVFPENLQAENSGQSITKLELLIQGFAPDDRKNPTDPAYYLLGDVQKCLALEKSRDDGFDILGLGCSVTAMRIGQGVVRPPDGVVSDTAFFWLPVTLEFAENQSKPIA